MKPRRAAQRPASTADSPQTAFMIAASGESALASSSDPEVTDFLGEDGRSYLARLHELRAREGA